VAEETGLDHLLDRLMEPQQIPMYGSYRLEASLDEASRSCLLFGCGHLQPGTELGEFDFGFGLKGRLQLLQLACVFAIDARLDPFANPCACGERNQAADEARCQHGDYGLLPASQSGGRDQQRMRYRVQRRI